MKLHSIANGRAEVQVLEQGGTIAGFKVGGEDIFFPWRETDGKTRGGCPFCAPWFGSSPRGDKKHGYLRNAVPCGRYISPVGAQFEFCLPGTEHYPWSLHCYTTATLFASEVLQISLRVERMLDSVDGEAPVLPALHPYFVCGNADEVKVVVGQQVHSGFSGEARPIPLDGWKRVVIHTPNRMIEMDLLGAFSSGNYKSQLVFWTDSKNQYFCVEPLLEIKQLFDTPEGCHLDQGETVEISARFKAL